MTATKEPKRTETTRCLGYPDYVGECVGKCGCRACRESMEDAERVEAGLRRGDEIRARTARDEAITHAVRLDALDVGFDLRAHDLATRIPAGDFVSVIIDGPAPRGRCMRLLDAHDLDGGRVCLVGRREPMMRALRLAGYRIAQV